MSVWFATRAVSATWRLPEGRRDVSLGRCSASSPPRGRHRGRSNDEVGGRVVTHRPANDAARAGVDDRGVEEPALVRQVARSTGTTVCRKSAAGDTSMRYQRTWRPNDDPLLRRLPRHAERQQLRRQDFRQRRTPCGGRGRAHGHAPSASTRTPQSCVTRSARRSSPRLTAESRRPPRATMLRRKSRADALRQAS